MARFALFKVLCSIAPAAVASSASAQMFPVDASGWNADVIVENTASPPYATAAQAFDVSNNWAWYESGLPGTTKGLPAGGAFNPVVDATVSVQFRPYNAPNALLLNAGTPSGTLTLDPSDQIPYSSLGIVASSANGGGAGTLVITFTDSSTSANINYNAQDWFFVTTNNALNNRGRLNLGTDLPDDASAGNPRLYYTSINLAALGFSNRSVASITFNKPATSNTTAIFAISGQRSVNSATPVAASGWNRDLIVENTATVPYSNFASAFDTFNGVAHYEAGLPGGTKGLPAGGAFTSLADANISGQFQPYSQNNALFLDSGAPTASLTFDASAVRPYEFLVIFASSTNQGGLGSLVITFANSTTSPAISFNAQDWFNVTTNNALNNLGRVGLAAATTDDASAGNPRIYQTVIDLGARGLSDRAIASISFTKPAVGGAAQNTAIFAVSGQPVPGVVGACTFPDGVCAQLPQANCSGTYAGDNTTCPPTGACIASGGQCTVRFQANCNFVGGTYLGDNQPCPASGACIAANGDCTQVNTFECAAQGGNFLGAGSPCPTPGACCLTAGCSLLNSFQCLAQGGSFQGAGTVCDYSYPSIQTSAAAFEDISATGAEISWIAGTNDDGSSEISLGFTFPFFNTSYTSVFVVTNGFLTFPSSNTAFTNACPVPAAAAPNSAIYPLWDDLHVGSATFLHPGRVYFETRFSPTRFIVQWNRVGQYNSGQVPTDENTFQVILYENGNIDLRYLDITAQVACDATIGIENAAGSVGLNYDNTLLGTGNTSLSIAAMNPCQQPPTQGACCAGTTCSVQTAAACTGPNTSYAGDGTACNAPGNFNMPCCKGDYNQSGGITVQDIFDFLTGYFSSDPLADINSGGISVQDIFDFLSAYFGGGC